jgi:hypothetical protein
METPPKKVARRALVYGMLFLSLMVLTALPVLAQLPEPEVTFIPDQLSAESSFVMIADPGSVGGSVRITWVTDEGYGHFPWIDGEYMCYFSDTDYQSTCGPSPFRYPTAPETPYLLDVFTFDSEGNQGNTTVEVEIGGLKIIPDVTVDFDEGSVKLLAYTTPAIADSISYRVFDSSFSPKTSGYLSMSRITGTPYYNGSVELEPGTYYIAFKAETPDDFGGGMIKVDMAGGDGNGYEGILQADPVDIEVVVEAGAEPSLPVSKRIINTLNQSFEGVSISLPADISKYVTITIPNSTIEAYQTMYYSINLHSISSSLDINTVADIKSKAGTVLGEIPVKMKISYTSGGVTDCSQLADGADCLGGICCNKVCQKKAECCADGDCGYGEICSSYRCVSGTSTDMPCSTGICMTDGSLSCPSGQEETGTCISGGVTYICCADTGECAGRADGTTCSGGVCCDEECVECCDDSDCDTGYECVGTYCLGISGNGESEGIDLLTIGLIVALAALAGLGAWWFFKKYKKGKPEEEEFREGEGGEDVFEEEEFY